MNFLEKQFKGELELTEDKTIQVISLCTLPWTAFP